MTLSYLADVMSKHGSFNSERLSSAVCYFIHTKTSHRFYDFIIYIKSKYSQEYAKSK